MAQSKNPGNLPEPVNVLERRAVVDVSECDWSEHPAWGSDFEASTMQCPPDEVPEWAGEVIRIEEVVVDGDGERHVIER